MMDDGAIAQRTPAHRPTNDLTGRRRSIGLGAGAVPDPVTRPEPLPRRSGATADGDHVRAGAASYTFDHLSAIATVLDRDGRIVDTNEAWRRFGRRNGASVAATGAGISYLDVCDRSAATGEVSAAAAAFGLRRILNGDRDHFSLEYACPSPTEERWFLLQASAAPVAGGTGAVLLHVDITAGKLREQQFADDAERDDLTGLPNRRAAVRAIGQHLDGPRSVEVLWVLYLDLDGFKGVNDDHGHVVGDELLVKVAARSQRVLRDEDRLFRIGGDEFVVVCPGLTPESALTTANRLRGVLGVPFEIGGIAVSVGVSIGAAMSTPPCTVDSLLQSADARMYLDKGRRRRRLGRDEAAPISPADTDGPPVGLLWRDTDPSSPAVRPTTGPEHHQLVLDALGAAVIVQDRSGRVIDANLPARELLGAASTAATIIPPGWSLVDANHATLDPSDLPGRRALATGTVCQTVVGLTDSDGGVRWLAITSRPVTIPGDEEPTFVVSSFRLATRPSSDGVQLWP